MTETESIELARAYVALSNAHRIDLITPMFASDALYRSSAAGEFKGVDAIADMMQAFFKHYADVFWSCDHFRYQSNRVSFDFKLHASDSQSGELLQRGGLEHIEFDNEGRIKTLEVIAD